MAPRMLGQGLHKWMIFFIVISSVIGSGIFSKGGSAVKIAGPGGALLAFATMSVVAICVSECISELVQLFPISNAIVEYVRKFIDEDFGWAIGIAYWLTYSSIFAAQNMTAAHLSEYWGGPDPQAWRTVVFYFFAPVTMLVINLFPVRVFGWIESVGGAIKILLVVGTTFTLFAMAGRTQPKWLDDGFQHNPNFIGTNVGAVCYVVPIMAFGFIGIETITVTAFEAKPKHLRWPSRYTIYVAVFVYLLCMLSQYLNISWRDDHLPTIYGGANVIQQRAPEDEDGTEDPSSHVLVIIAIFKWGKKALAGFLNGAIIFSVLSASNTSLYVASRTLYGMTLRITDSSLLGRFAHSFSRVHPKTKVPVQALITSFLMFFWVPFMSLKRDYKFQNVIEIIQTSSSVSCLLVWIALCVSFLRLWWWQTRFKSQLKVNENHYEKFHRNAEAADVYGASTLFMVLQPMPAIIAIIGCVVIFVFCSATWWLQPITFPKVAIAYAAQSIVGVIFLILKVRRWLKSKTVEEQARRRERRRPMFRTRFKDFTRIVDELLRMKWESDTGDDLANLPRCNGGNTSAYEMRTLTALTNGDATEQARPVADD